MLVVSRKREECLVIGNVVVSIIRLGPENVRLGIDAPVDVKIWRGEWCPELVEKLKTPKADK